SVPTFFYHFDPDKPEYFEVFSVDNDFSLENSFSGLPIERPEKYSSLGFVKNEPVSITANEYLEMLSSGKKLIPEIDLVLRQEETV
ncbi:MAG: hypothetical protein KDB79_13345, partial [Acidobacteria bacterium]|nr:hypothetical protein [Acidobacteriota bacterium]